MKPTKEDWDRFGREIMTGGRSEDVTTERNYENIIEENAKLKQDNKVNQDCLDLQIKNVSFLENENEKLKQDKQELIEWLKQEIEKCDEDTVINRAKPNVRFWRLYDLREVLAILNEGSDKK